VLTLAGLSDSDLGSYDVVITNDCGVTTSRPVSLAYAGPTVFSSPAASSTNFTVNLTGSPGLTVTVEKASAVTGPWQKKVNLTIPESGSLLFNEPVAGQNVFYRTVYPAY
jgi:hypothetical protein